MDKEKATKLRKNIYIAAFALIPAIASGVLSYLESTAKAKKGTKEVTQKAEAGYQVTRSAYESMLQDVAGMKVEIRILREILFNGGLPAPPTSLAEPSAPPPAPVPAPPAEDTAIAVPMPPSLEAAQKKLED